MQPAAIAKRTASDVASLRATGTWSIVVSRVQSPKLNLSLLGRFAVEYDGAPVAGTAWRRKRPVHLLTALALAPGHVLHREELIDRLWPDKTLDAGANNLYRTLHDLRGVTGDDVVAVERGTVRLHDDAWVDVRAFEEATAASGSERWLAAIELYRGDLLPDDPYSDLIGPRRDGLRQRFVDTALRVASTDDVDVDRRLAVLRRLVEVAPVLERGHRLLMTTLAAVGRKEDAARQYAACVGALREHLDAAPSQETNELHAQLKRSKPTLPPARSTTSNREPDRAESWNRVASRLLGTDEPSPLRGRQAALHDATRFAATGGALVVAGEAGAGKTRMAVECARLCAMQGSVVIAGLGYEFEGTAPYTPFVDAWTDAQRLSPGDDNPFLSFEPTVGGSAQEDRMRLFAAVERSLARLAGDGSVCILIEDLHQTDESSLHLFHHLARASRRMPIRIIGTVREEEIGAGNPLHVFLSSLQRERGTVRIRLPRLDLEGTRALIADRWGEPPDDATVASAFELAGGNPFFTEEVAASMREQSQADFSPSTDLMQTIRARVTRLGETPHRLLVAAAVQGVRFDFEVAQQAAAVDTEPALDALDAALAAGVVEEQSRRYRFRHALMREALYRGLSRARRVHMHRATGRALEAVPEANRAEPELLAHHHHAAGDLERALPYTLQTITHAQSRLGFGEAVTQSERALEMMAELGVNHGARHFEVLRQMGAMRVALGDLDAAVNDLDRAAEAETTEWAPSPAQRCGARRLAALALIEGGRLELAEERLADGLASLGEHGDDQELANLHYLYSQLRWHQSRHAEAFSLAEKCLGYAERTGSAESISKGYEMLALACHSLGEWKKGRDFEERRKEVTGGTLDVASAFDVHL